jgi:RNA polymerase primary sigma factor
MVRARRPAGSTALLTQVDDRAEECRAELRDLARRRDGGTEGRDGIRRQTADLLSELSRLRVVASLAGKSAPATPRGSSGYLRARRPRHALDGPAEARLVAAAREGDADACHELVEAFLPLIAAVARVYRRSGALDRAELMQAGIAGLLTALQRYDGERGTPFWAYAGWWVRQSMQHLTAELAGPVVLSDRALRQLARMRDARRAHQQARGADPSAGDLATSLGVTAQEIERLLAVERMPRALDEPFDDGGDRRGARVLADPDSEAAYDRVLQEAEIDGIHGALAALTDRERAIVRDRYGLEGEPHTLREIAGGLGVSAERVRQLERRALDVLRDASDGRQRPERRRADSRRPA